MFLNNIQKMYLVHFLITLHFFGAVLIPFFTDFGGLNFTQIMILQSWFMFWFFVLEIPTGTVADFFGRKVSIAASGIIGALGLIIYVSAPNFYVFMLAEFLLAAGAALRSGADTALIYDTLKQEKREKQSKEILSRYESFGLAGILIGSSVGSIIAANFGITAPVLFSAFPLFLATLLVITVPEPKIFRTIKRENYGKILSEGFAFFTNHKILKVLALDLAIISTAGHMMIWAFQPLLKESGVPIFWYGFVLSASVLAQILILNKINFLERFFDGKKKYLLASAIIVGAAFLLAGFSKFIPLILVSILTAIAFGKTRGPVINSYANKYIPTAKRATILSSISMINRITTAIAYPIVGFAIDKFSLDYTLIGLGAVTIIFAFYSGIEEKMLKE